MKTKNILGLVILGAVAWYFLKPKKALAEETATKEVIPPKIEPKVDKVDKLDTIISKKPGYKEYPLPPPGAYITKITDTKKKRRGWKHK